jgi:hypothetical protein
VKTTFALSSPRRCSQAAPSPPSSIPRAFQSWRKKDRGITGSNLPRREGDEATLKGMEAEDLAKMQRGGGIKEQLASRPTRAPWLSVACAGPA